MLKNEGNLFLGRYVVLWMGIVLGYFYIHQVSIPTFSQRLTLLNNLILMGEVKADYFYAMYFMALISQFLINIFGHPKWVFAIIDFIGMIFLFQCAYYFLIRLFPNIISKMAALLFLAVTTPLLFRMHYYHPSDFYAVGLMFLILVAAREQRYLLLAALCLISGMLWEKALFVPLFFLIYMICINGIKKGLLFSLPAIITTTFYFITWRVLFPQMQRIHLLTLEQLLYRLPRDLTEWGVWTLPILLILLDILIYRRKFELFWILWLIYAPLLILGLIVMTHFWGELRTFWILQPIFAGFIASWIDCRFSDYLIMKKPVAANPKK